MEIRTPEHLYAWGCTPPEYWPFWLSRRPVVQVGRRCRGVKVRAERSWPSVRVLPKTAQEANLFRRSALTVAMGAARRCGHALRVLMLAAPTGLSERRTSHRRRGEIASRAGGQEARLSRFTWYG